MFLIYYFTFNWIHCNLIVKKCGFAVKQTLYRRITCARNWYSGCNNLLIFDFLTWHRSKRQYYLVAFLSDDKRAYWSYVFCKSLRSLCRVCKTYDEWVQTCSIPVHATPMIHGRKNREICVRQMGSSNSNLSNANKIFRNATNRYS